MLQEEEEICKPEPISDQVPNPVSEPEEEVGQ